MIMGPDSVVLEMNNFMYCVFDADHFQCAFFVPELKKKIKNDNHHPAVTLENGM